MPGKSPKERATTAGPQKVARKVRGASPVTAETLAEKQREISVSEFFAKNRHLLGFDNPRKALLTTVKEAVDNALDACEEAGILPEIGVSIEEIGDQNGARSSQGQQAGPAAPTRYRVTIDDNGPGIVRRQIENIFGRLLYGSKFHRLKMSRGQQGIGISAAGMYGLMTTGRPMVITTRPKKGKPAHHIELAMDTARNRPVVSVDVETDDFPDRTGTRVSIELVARYSKGRTSVDEYLEQTAIANPHARISYSPPAARGRSDAEPDDSPPLEFDDSAESATAEPTATTTASGAVIFPRTVEELPAETREIKPHPYGVELGTFLQMLSKSEERQIGGFLKNEFSRITPQVAGEVTRKAGVTPQSWVKSIDHAAAEKLYNAIQHARLRAPPTDCLSPIGVRQILAGLLKGVKAEFYTASTRPPAVYRGMPFQIEVGIAFGGELAGSAEAQGGEAQSRIIRFANRVPLLYQQAACSSFKAVLETSWRNYGVSQPRGSAPQAPMIVMIHMASVWVPFTSESKEAIADYDEVRKEMKLALQECGRKLGSYLRKRQRMKREAERRDVFQKYIGEIAKACNAISGVDAQKLYESLLAQARDRTAVADVELDDEGRTVRPDRTSGGDDDTVIVVDSDGPPPAPAPASAATKAGGRPRRPRGTTREAGAKPAAEDAPSGRKDRPRAPSGVKSRPRPHAAVSPEPATTSEESQARPSVANKGKPKPRVRLELGSAQRPAEPSLFAASAGG